AAIKALGNVGGEKAVDRLLTLSRSTIPNQRIAAIEALSKAKNFK
ncbi:HEAT repeat domain-containing protein, partial [Acinetobacter sp. CFCC 10889]